LIAPTIATQIKATWLVDRRNLGNLIDLICSLSVKKRDVTYMHTILSAAADSLGVSKFDAGTIRGGVFLNFRDCGTAHLSSFLKMTV